MQLSSNFNLVDFLKSQKFEIRFCPHIGAVCCNMMTWEEGTPLNTFSAFVGQQITLYHVFYNTGCPILKRVKLNGPEV